VGTFSLPFSSSATSVASLVSVMSSWGKSAWSAASGLSRSKGPRNAQEMLDWAHRLTATQPALAAEWVAIASRSMD